MCGLEQNISNDHHVYESCAHDWAGMDDAFWSKNENLLTGESAMAAATEEPQLCGQQSRHSIIMGAKICFGLRI